jgi:hypothetical protein
MEPTWTLSMFREPPEPVQPPEALQYCPQAADEKKQTTTTHKTNARQFIAVNTNFVIPPFSIKIPLFLDILLVPSMFRLRLSLLSAPNSLICYTFFPDFLKFLLNFSKFPPIHPSTLVLTKTRNIDHYPKNTPTAVY